ncbi:hypothetical protein [Nocardioides currus]|uniref:Uncharacterized protein n=1 Tax=Nocardioides currus TaxID=2133958 RepID=A0A2R7YVJ3_9ACTN|nr:hypothetical protein [Nocardioides currus]PUA80427.1 hypothetical protein C7S10_15000 [Nocardioides currus]
MPGPESDAREWDDEDPDLHDDDTEPAWFPGQHLPGHARQMGLTHHVPEGALLDFAGSLNGAKPLHRFAAWLLLVVFGLPVVFTVMRIWGALT